MLRNLHVIITKGSLLTVLGNVASKSSAGPHPVTDGGPQSLVSGPLALQGSQASKPPASTSFYPMSLEFISTQDALTLLAM